MAWIITYDHVDECPRLFGSFGDIKELRYPFRLYDDDKELYFSGFSDDRDSQIAFDPLDYCTDRYGCTRIDYLQDDESWETL
jgi:hypothetical protein